VPLVYVNQRRAIIAIEKGAPGERAFDDAFAAWGNDRGDAVARAVASAGSRLRVVNFRLTPAAQVLARRGKSWRRFTRDVCLRRVRNEISRARATWWLNSSGFVTTFCSYQNAEYEAMATRFVISILRLGRLNVRAFSFLAALIKRAQLRARPQNKVAIIGWTDHNLLPFASSVGPTCRGTARASDLV
jgi:hypothetical protein